MDAPVNVRNDLRHDRGAFRDYRCRRWFFSWRLELGIRGFRYRRWTGPTTGNGQDQKTGREAAHRLFIISFNNNLWLDIWFQSIDSMPPVGIRVHVAATPETESHPLFNPRKPMLKRGTGWHRRVYTNQTSTALNAEEIATCLSATSLNGHTKIPSRGSLAPRERHQRPDPQQRRL